MDIQRIQERAYALWLEEGCQHGRAHEHWLRAERELVHAPAEAKEIAREGRSPRLLVQVNTGEEPQKGGVMPAEADAFIAACRDKRGLTIEGLMCIPPAEDPPSPHFTLLQTIARRNGLKTLSMGMSADFEAAIQLGATHVRVGSAIFGERTAR